MSTSSSIPPPGPKRIIVCCDGTTNDGINSDEPLTNVARMARCISYQFNREGPPMPQVVYYRSGIGTSSSWYTNYVESWGGRGIDEKLLQAYSFICYNYASLEDILIFTGFSRGAYEVLVLARFIYDVGILKKPSLRHLRKLYYAWEANELPACLAQLGPDIDRFLDVEIRACAVWDTVSALGSHYSDTLDVVVPNIVPPNVSLVIHALALDEARGSFPPLLWKLPSPNERNPSAQRLEQCWFLGVHADVGGGGRADCALSNIALAWVLSHLQAHVQFTRQSLLNLAPEARVASAMSSNISASSMKSMAHTDSETLELEMVIPKEPIRTQTEKYTSRLSGSMKRMYKQRRQPLVHRVSPGDTHRTYERIHWTVQELHNKGVITCIPYQRLLAQNVLVERDYVARVDDHFTRLLLKDWAIADLTAMIMVNNPHLTETAKKRDGLTSATVASEQVKHVFRFKDAAIKVEAGVSHEVKITTTAQPKDISVYAILATPDSWFECESSDFYAKFSNSPNFNYTENGQLKSIAAVPIEWKSTRNKIKALKCNMKLADDLAGTQTDGDEE